MANIINVVRDNGNSSKDNGKSKGRHPAANWAKTPDAVKRWFTGESGPNEGWTETVDITVKSRKGYAVFNAGSDSYAVEFKDFPVNLRDAVKTRNGRLPKYMRRLIVAYFSHILLDMETDEVNAFDAGLKDALGVTKGTYLFTGEARYNTGNWLNQVHTRLMNAEVWS